MLISDVVIWSEASWSSYLLNHIYLEVLYWFSNTKSKP